VVTPSYNQDQFIEETLRSVLLQGYPNLEYIVNDGGSSDTSIEIIKKYQQWLSSWVSEKDRGQSHAINKGWKIASGDLIAYLNSDDIYYPNTLRDAVLAWHQSGRPAVVYSDAVVVSEVGSYMGLAKSDAFNLRRMRAQRNPIRQPSAFISRKDAAAINFIDEALHYVMDYDFWYRLARRGRLVYVSGKRWSAMRMHAQTKTSAHKPAISEEFEKVLLQRLAEDGLSQESDDYRKILSERQFLSALKLSQSGRRRDAIAAFVKAGRRTPLFVLQQPKRLLFEFSARLLIGSASLRSRPAPKR
jgi:glycosyltransferase involved in cell wall biosynthesis